MYLDLKKGSRERKLAILVVIILAVFIVRLFYLQIIRHDYYVAAARTEQLKQLDLPAERGEIYMMNRQKPVKVVLNETVFTVFADPVTVKKPDEVADLIRRVAGGNARPNLDSMLRNKKSRYQIVATKVTMQQAEMMKKSNLSGLGFQRGNQRVYPEGQLAAQTLGFVDNAGVGRYGLEGSLDARLAGTDGLLQTVTDVRDVPLTIGKDNIKQPAKNGDNVVMTIDQNVQSYTEQALAEGLKRTGATNGSVMVMDPQTGKIMAMANLPTFDPANYSQVSDIAAFNNATISAPYEPGSVIKTFTMATGIDKGVVSANSTFNNTDLLMVEDKRITNATKGQTGIITFQHALNYSLNTGFVTVAERLGDGSYITRQARDTLYNYFHDKFGMGVRTGIELSGEAQGIVVPPTNADGGAVRYSNMTFGQGLDVPMIQVAAAFGAAINGGTYHTPSIVAGTLDDSGENFTPAVEKATKPGVIKASTSDEIRTMLHDARSAFYSGKDKKGYYIGGKTGTSQTLLNGVYVDKETVGTYLGFGGDDSSSTGAKYVIMVQVSGKDMNLGGNTDAMPIFTDISNWMLSYLKLHPKGNS